MRNITVGAAAVLVLWLVLVPVVYLLWGTFFDTAGFTLDSFKRAYGDPQAATMVRNSIVYGFGATLLGIAFGTVLAYLVVRTDAPYKRLIIVGSLVPAFLPGILYAPAWIFLAGDDTGLLTWTVESVGLGLPVSIYSIWGMVWVEGLRLAPIAFLLMAAAFRSIDPSLEESALISGARRWTIIRRITIPLARPAIAAALLIIVVQALESFDVPLMIGQHDDIFVFTSRMYFLLRLFPPDYGAAGALGVGLVVIAVATALLMRIGRAKRTSYQTVTGKGFRARTLSLGRARPVVGGLVALYFVVTIVAPIGSLIYASLLPYFRVPSAVTWGDFTLDNYRTILSSADELNAFKNTILLGVGSAVLVMLLAAIISWFVVRTNARGRGVMSGLSFAPLLIPGLVLGLAVSFVYLRFPVPLYGTIWILLIAYVTRFLPYGMQYAGASMSQVAAELEEAAHVAGARWAQSFRRVLLPLASPGIVAGGIYVLTVSFRELGASVLLVNPDTEVLSVRIYSQFSQGDLSELSATGVLMIAVLSALCWIGYKIGNRVGVRLN